jgi:hypothetical protein
VFVNEFAARLYAVTIPDPIERVLVSAALCKSIAFLISDPQYQKAGHPFDLLTHVRSRHAFVANTALFVDILVGRYRNIDELPDAF